MITLYKHTVDVPYSLHDMRICRIENIDKTLKLYFEDGYLKNINSYQKVIGNVSIEKVNYDFCFAYLLSNDGNVGEFSGKKYFLLDFLVQYKKFSFEVIDETYGYNAVVYNGYLKVAEKDVFIELALTISYLGNIIYETEE